MYRVYLVDDEPFITQGLIDGVDWGAFGLEICGKAANGQQALQQMPQLAVDILITDIMMPRLNGLELIREVRALLPELKVIILSGYNEFEYLKRGLTLGIENYLLKPINLEELYATLRNTIEKIHAGQRSLDVTDEEKHILQDNILYRWITDQISEEAFGERASLLKIKPEGDFVLAAVARQQAKRHVQELRREIDAELLVPCFRNVEDDFVMVFLGDTPEACERSANETIGRFRRRGVANDYRISFGTVEPTGGGQRISYENALKAQEYFILLEHGEIARYRPVVATDQLPLSRVEIAWEDYRALILSQEVDTLLSRIEQDFQDLLTVSGINPESLRDLAVEIMIRMKMEIHKFNQSDPATGEMHAWLFRKVSQSTRKDELLEAVKEAARLIVGELEQTDHSPIIKQIVRYAELRYADNLSLKSLGQKHNVHPAYLGRLFQRETGEAFTEYLNKIRVEKAKELLRHSALKVHEIASQVGYIEPSYFHKQFKKYVGVTPYEYKARQ